MNQRPLDAVPYAPGVTDASVRLLGPVDGKRVLVLGARDERPPAVFATEGAKVFVVEPDVARIRRAEERAGDAANGIEWHPTDHADLAFLRADSIDLAFSAAVVDEIEDFARVLRQVHRVLRPGGTFLFGYDHPLARCVVNGELTRAWNDTKPLTLERDGDERTVFPRPPADVFVALTRAGFRVDALAEPADDTKIPAAMVWRARREGA